MLPQPLTVRGHQFHDLHVGLEDVVAVVRKTCLLLKRSDLVQQIFLERLQPLGQKSVLGVAWRDVHAIEALRQSRQTCQSGCAGAARALPQAAASLCCWTSASPLQGKDYNRSVRAPSHCVVLVEVRHRSLS